MWDVDTQIDLNRELLDILNDWRANHPDGKRSRCMRDTGLSRTFVEKWWDGEDAVRERYEERCQSQKQNQ